MRLISSFQLNSFGRSIKKSARGSKIPHSNLAIQIFFLPFRNCIPSFHFIVISKRIKLQRCDCAQLVDFSMKFLKLFLFFRFGHRKAFKSDVTGERILISKVVGWTKKKYTVGIFSNIETTQNRNFFAIEIMNKKLSLSKFSRHLVNVKIVNI